MQISLHIFQQMFRQEPLQKVVYPLRRTDRVIVECHKMVAVLD
jgi:hypothetical protein